MTKSERSNYDFGVRLNQGEFVTIHGANLTKEQAYAEAEKLQHGFACPTQTGVRLITKYNIMYIDITKA